MKTIFCKDEFKLWVNDRNYNFFAGDFIQKSDIEDMQNGRELSCDNIYRYYLISKLTNKDVEWFINNANLNEVYGYRIINIL